MICSPHMVDQPEHRSNQYRYGTTQSNAYVNGYNSWMWFGTWFILNMSIMSKKVFKIYMNENYKSWLLTYLTQSSWTAWSNKNKWFLYNISHYNHLIHVYQKLHSQFCLILHFNLELDLLFCVCFWFFAAAWAVRSSSCIMNNGISSSLKWL